MAIEFTFRITNDDTTPEDAAAIRQLVESALATPKKRGRGRPMADDYAGDYAALYEVINACPQDAKSSEILSAYKKKYGASIANGKQPDVDTKIIRRERSRKR